MSTLSSRHHHFGHGKALFPGWSAQVATPAQQAYRILHLGYVALPIIAGADKFFHLLGNWNQYLAPQVPQLLHVGNPAFMQVVGIIEIFAGLLVAVMPRIGAYVVAAWLWGIIANLLLLGGYYDIALRDFGLSLGAFALGRLAAREPAAETPAEIQPAPKPS